MCGPQIRVCLFTLRPIASKQLNSLATIESQNLLVTHPIPGSNKSFYVWFFVVVFLLSRSFESIYLKNQLKSEFEN